VLEPVPLLLLLTFDPIEPRDRPEALTEQDAHDIGAA